MPGCTGFRVNYWPGGGTTYGYTGFGPDGLYRWGTNRAVDQTYGLYIPGWDTNPGIPPQNNRGDITKYYISWGKARQTRAKCWAERPAPNNLWYEAVSFAMQQNIPGFDVNNASTWCNDSELDNRYRPGPLALESAYSSQDDNGIKSYHDPIRGAWLGNNLFTYNIGYPYNNGGTEWVRRWGAGWTQDFTCCAQGTGALMQSDVSPDIAYWIYGTIWSQYVLNQGGGEGWLGYPAYNRQQRQNLCGTVDYQKFQRGFIIWNCGPWQSSEYSAPTVPIDDNSPLVFFSNPSFLRDGSGWRLSRNCEPSTCNCCPPNMTYLGTVSYTNIPGDSASFIFLGSQVKYIYTKAYNRAKAEIIIDGSSFGLEDEYCASPCILAQQTYTSPLLTYGTHTIVVKHSGQHTPNDCGTCWIDVDAFIAQ